MQRRCVAAAIDPGNGRYVHQHHTGPCRPDSCRPDSCRAGSCRPGRARQSAASPDRHSHDTGSQGHGRQTRDRDETSSCGSSPGATHYSSLGQQRGANKEVPAGEARREGMREAVDAANGAGGGPVRLGHGGAGRDRRARRPSPLRGLGLTQRMPTQRSSRRSVRISVSWPSRSTASQGERIDEVGLPAWMLMIAAASAAWPVHRTVPDFNGRPYRGFIFGC